MGSVCRCGQSNVPVNLPEMVKYEAIRVERDKIEEEQVVSDLDDFLGDLETEIRDAFVDADELEDELECELPDQFTENSRHVELLRIILGRGGWGFRFNFTERNRPCVTIYYRRSGSEGLG